MPVTRREFIAAAAALPLAAADTPVPTRVLGKTGARVSMLAFGTGSRFLQYKEEDEALAALNRALDLGITYIDTADEYGKGHLAEQRVGKALKGRRDSVFLATKVSPRDPDEAARSFETSLKSLQVDRVDLLHIHALTTDDDLAKIEAKGGVYDLVTRLKEEKLARFIGITSHADPSVMKTALERHDFDCAQMALNAGMTAMINGGGKRGMVPNPEIHTSFETLALPVAQRRNMGVLAIKAFAQDHLIGQAPLDKLLYYTLSLPITAAVVGMPKIEHIADNVRMAKAFQPLPPAEMKSLGESLTTRNRAALDDFFRHHVDAC
jgi:aryl-alcohol dehydrogenase-like predicted oxidoreductase